MAAKSEVLFFLRSQGESHNFLTLHFGILSAA